LVSLLLVACAAQNGYSCITNSKTSQVVANLVSEPLFHRISRAGGGIEVARWLTLPVFSVWLIEAQVASERRRIRKHGYANVLRDLGRATTPPQVSALCSCVQILHGGSAASSAMTCTQAPQDSAPTSRAGSWFLPSRKSTTAKEQQAGIWCGTAPPILTLKSAANVFDAKVRLCVVLSPGDPSLRYCNETLQTPAGPDISLLRPELQQQWHHAKNEHLGDRQITTSSDLRVWWSCDQCPSGLLHEWLATIDSRQNMDHQCPFCTNHRMCQHNTLLTMAPAVAVYWDSAKNALTPEQVMAHSATRRHWLCPSCGHSWQAPIFSKVRDRSGCPKCSSKHKAINKKPTLTQSQHPAMMEFDFVKNRKAGLDPDNITAGSGKMVHWICTNCPKGQPHLFMAKPAGRIGLSRGCPYCASRKACICNSLQSLYPSLAAEYDSAKNGVGPGQVLPRSHKKAFWKDASGHTWEQSPCQRTEPEHQRIKRASIKSRLEKQA